MKKGRRQRTGGQGASEAEARSVALVETAVDPVITMDRAGRVLDWNPAAERIFGYSEADATGRELVELIVPPSLQTQYRAAITHYADTGEATLFKHRVELFALRADGSELPVELTLTRLDNAGEAAFACVVRDITTRVLMEKQLAHEALHDPLTGLPNRKLLLDRLAGALSRARRTGGRTALMFVDLDGFKAVNDERGHPTGDKLLETIAMRLAESLRPSDTVARFGGDEFAVVCENVEIAEALAIARRLRETVAAGVTIDGQDLCVTSSIGITFSEGGAGTVEALLAEADASMYSAKNHGPGRIRTFSGGAPRSSLAHENGEDELRQALDRGELTVLYQPLVDVPAGAVVGAEALVRWDHPRDGRLPPDAFIPIAEEIGLIQTLGELVLRDACRNAERWATRPGEPHFAVAVNVSAAQLHDGRLPSMVAGVLASCGVDPGSVWLDIPEQAMGGGQVVNDALRAITAMGVRIAVDDFGTGTSSLSQLRRLTVGAVKVDMTLTGGIDRPGDESAIVGAMTEMAHALDIGVIAEGVEREGQMRVLRRCGCDHAQGYLFGHPEPPERVDEMLAAAAA